ncbi:MAG: antitoxin family protein [Nitrospira sp.]|nr:antitoxin family protein [Nitrospira sp.]
MTTTIRARMKGGIIEPLDRVDLPDGQDMMITILIPPSTTDLQAFRCSAGRWQGTFDPQALIDEIYADRLVLTRSAPAL